MIFLTIDNKFMANVFKLDTRDFNRTIDKYIEMRNLDYLQEVNRRAANIIMKAMQETKVTNPLRIEADLKAIVQSFKSARQLKTGKESKRKKFKPFYKGAPVGYKIFNWRRKNRPRSLRPDLRGGGLAWEQMGTQFDLFVKATKSSVAYIKAGWLPALNRYKQQGIKIKSDIKREPSPQTSAGKGYAIPAQRVGDFLKTTFANAANGVGKIGVSALARAFNREEQDMKGKILEMEQKRLNKLKR
jgi:hypothetical protein